MLLQQPLFDSCPLCQVEAKISTIDPRIFALMQANSEHHLADRPCGERADGSRALGCFHPFCRCGACKGSEAGRGTQRTGERQHNSVGLKTRVPSGAPRRETAPPHPMLRGGTHDWREPPCGNRGRPAPGGANSAGEENSWRLVCVDPDSWVWSQVMADSRSHLVIAVVGQHKRDAWDFVRHVCQSASLNPEQALADGRCFFPLVLRGKRLSIWLQFVRHPSPESAGVGFPLTFTRTPG